MVDTPIGTNLPTYTLVSGDLGATIYCRVTATNASGSSNTISNVVGPITAAVAPVNTGLPNITDTTPEVTVAVSCTTGTWTGDPTITYAYQWKKGGTNIVGATSASYTPVVGDIGATLSCVVTATNGAGSASATSNTTGAVAAAPSGPAATNMWCHLKADAGVYNDAGTTLATNGQTVQRWGDQSATGTRHFNQTTAGNRPTFVTNAVNTTLPVVRFVATPGVPATTAFMTGPDLSAFTAGEIFLVIKKAGADPGDGVEAALWQCDVHSSANLYPFSDGHIYDGWGSNTRYDSGDPTPSLTSWRLYNVVSTATEWTSFIDGTQQFTNTTDPGIGFTVFTLCQDTGSGNTFSGDIAELIVYSAKCSTPDKAQTKSYIASKYGLTIAP